VLDVAKQYVDTLIPEGRDVAKTVLVYFNLARDAFTIKLRSKVYIR
jgi:hypothetical protein